MESTSRVLAVAPKVRAAMPRSLWAQTCRVLKEELQVLGEVRGRGNWRCSHCPCCPQLSVPEGDHVYTIGVHSASQTGAWITITRKACNRPHNQSLSVSVAQQYDVAVCMPNIFSGKAQHQTWRTTGPEERCTLLKIFSTPKSPPIRGFHIILPLHFTASPA